MLAALPEWVLDTGVIAGVVTAVIGALYAVGRFSDSVRGFFVKVRNRMWRGFEQAVKRATDDIRDDVTSIKKITDHHLGPNGDTPSLHVRVAKIEEFHSAESQ